MSLLDFSLEIQAKSKLFTKLVETSQKVLAESKDQEVELARSYLDSRLSKETQQKFHLGFLPNPENFKKFSDYFSLELLSELRIFYQSSVLTDWRSIFPSHPILLPYQDEQGNYIAVSARTILSEEERKEKKIEKYKNSFFNKNQYLFGLFQAKQAILTKGYALLVEGQFDTYTAHEKKFTETVALNGSSFSPLQQFLLRQYTKKVYILLDNDLAGQKASEKIKKNNFFNFEYQFLSFPVGYKDLSQYLGEHSEQEFLSQILNQPQ